ncbi:hypothetical protein PIB30_045161 [Stylosanthes scabra]|uniref:Myb/SANT-like domain-containing protein n=1 Tax=Stylosanthes scabra TaxID=79078 RepID=A0ABU6WEJ1_9FABA|nr:hypothetical protein [Stylosanthes scabra]
MDKRMWSEEETKAFVGFMEEVVVDGTRPHYGQFRASTFEKLALKMIERFPTCTVTTKHCKNKHKRMKEKYQYVADMLACSAFGWNAEKQCIDVDSKEVLETWLKIREEPNEEDPTLDDYFMSSEPTTIGPADNQGVPGQGTTTSVDCTASTRKLSGKKRKQADILERMADEVHESTAAQREHVQILANICSDPRLEKSFWGLTDTQKTTIAQDVLDGKY